LNAFIYNFPVQSHIHETPAALRGCGRTHHAPGIAGIRIFRNDHQREQGISFLDRFHLLFQKKAVEPGVEQSFVPEECEGDPGGKRRKGYSINQKRTKTRRHDAFTSGLSNDLSLPG
jgi:hypothetical protein